MCKSQARRGTVSFFFLERQARMPAFYRLLYERRFFFCLYATLWRQGVSLMKSTRYAFGRALALLCTFVFISFGFISCQTETEHETELDVYQISEDNALIGEWKSSYDEIFAISSTSLSNGGSWGDCYAGDSLLVSYTSEAQTSGYIYIKYTRAMNPDYSYSETAPDVGKWYALSFKNLTSSSIEISGAYKTGGKTSAETLEGALEEFSVENGYFDSYSECVKS